MKKDDGKIHHLLYDLLAQRINSVFYIGIQLRARTLQGVPLTVIVTIETICPKLVNVIIKINIKCIYKCCAFSIVNLCKFRRITQISFGIIYVMPELMYC